MNVEKLNQIHEAIKLASEQMELISEKIQSSIGTSTGISITSMASLKLLTIRNFAEIGLSAYLSELSDCEVSIIHAVMYFGRDSETNFAKLFSQLSNESKERMIDSILEKNPRSIYIHDGINKIIREKIDITSLCERGAAK